METLSQWDDTLACPLDHAPLMLTGGRWRCARCDFVADQTAVNGHAVADFRMLGRERAAQVTFRAPIAPLSRDELLSLGWRGVSEPFEHYPRREIRRRFGTKLDKGIQYHCQRALRDYGPDAPVLDLGCGSGGNRRYLQSIGFRNVLTVDWQAAGADMLVDAHTLPLADASFALVLATAVFEHLYNPFLAIGEVARVLRPGGTFIAGASFWEAWHGASCFHLTPDGWNALFHHAGLAWVDFWPGWGVMPALLSHMLTPGHLRGVGYALQRALEAPYRLIGGETAARRLQLRASGSFQVCARKPAP